MKRFMFLSIMILAFSFTMVGCLDDTKKTDPTPTGPQPKVITIVATDSLGENINVVLIIDSVVTVYVNVPSGSTYEITIPVGESSTFTVAAQRRAKDNGDIKLTITEVGWVTESGPEATAQGQWTIDN